MSVSRSLTVFVVQIQHLIFFSSKALCVKKTKTTNKANLYIHKSQCHVPLLHSLQHLASPDSSLCIPHCVFDTHCRRWQCHFPEVLNRVCAASQSPRSSFCPVGPLQHRLRTEIGHTPVWTSEPGGGHLAAGMRVLDLERPCLHPPHLPHLRLRDCCKETCRGVVGGATSLIALHYFWPPTYHSPLPPVSSSPCICQGEKDWHMHCLQLLHSVHLEFMS